MAILNLTLAESTVLNGLVHRGGSTSESLTCGFVTGDLSHFSHHFVRFSDAWERLDSGQRQAVIDVRLRCNLDLEGEKITPDNFVSVFIDWKKRQLFTEKEEAFWNQWGRNPQYEQHYYDDGELPPEEQKKIEASVKRILSKHL
ncbi:hypothetical protein FXE32_17725 [Vibrio cholerae]|uniref:hypothetical protein n=1 Tax=Vibrio cholerae TaxID=666 RepID=UPI0004E3FC56|nr:hypothetical protein [Vibrio cholerae]EGR4069181.1 hypothetical protein [Vibrio cholerae]KFE10820.1 hypothetical protein DN36_173 [Vibrio cholerae]TXZ77519.1 hypothetical protein FXE32_17725 [Vibrio cholerae]GHZ87252.1 hypothetical protein VCSRO35_0175 [Vibrio cholerae]